MLIEPQKDAVLARYAEGLPQVVWTTLVADLETPVSAMLKLSRNEEHCFLLESVEGGAVRGRYSIIGMDPDLVFKTVADTASTSHRCRRCAMCWKAPRLTCRKHCHRWRPECSVIWAMTMCG